MTSDPLFTEGNSQQFPLNLYLIKNVKNIVLLILKISIIITTVKKTRVSFIEKALSIFTEKNMDVSSVLIRLSLYGHATL